MNPSNESGPVEVIRLFSKSIRIDRHDLNLPINISDLNRILGSPREATKGGLNDIYTWDRLGLKAYARQGIVRSLAVHFSSNIDHGFELSMEVVKYDPVVSFHGELSIRQDFQNITGQTPFSDIEKVGFRIEKNSYVNRSDAQLYLGDRMSLFALPDTLGEVGMIEISFD